MVDTKEQFLAYLDEGREKMEEVVAIAKENQDIYPPWRIKEIVAHFTGWDDAVVTSLKSHAAGEIPAIVLVAARGPDTYNEATVTERESLSYELTLKEWRTTREMLKSIIKDMPDDKLHEPVVFPWGEEGTIAEMVDLFMEHEKEHADEIKQILLENRAH